VRWVRKDAKVRELPYIEYGVPGKAHRETQTTLKYDPDNVQLISY
jgi:hypothetical protein